MSVDNFEKGKIDDVYYDLGCFPNNRNKKRFIKAPFNIITLFNSQYIVPSQIPVGNSKFSEVFNSDTVDETYYQKFDDMGYHSLENIVIGEHEMGDYKGNPNTWKGLHQLNMI